MVDVALRVTPPDGWTPGALSPPDLTQAPRLTLEQWSSAARDGAIGLAWGCVRGDVGQWSNDASELAQGKLAELASGTLAKMGNPAPGLHVVATTDGEILEQTLESDGVPRARARTFVAFTRDPERAHACVVVCADTTRCDHAVADASVASLGQLAPPPHAGLGLRALSAAVHHPHAALGVLVGAVFFAAALAIATRPRPKRRDRR